MSLQRATRRAGTRLQTRRLGSPKSALAGIGRHVGTTAPASGGWRRSSMAAVQDDTIGSKTMEARAASDAGEALVKATCDRLELLISAGFSTATDGGRLAIFQATGHRRRHYLTTTCGKLVTEAAMRSPLLVCADPARKFAA